LKTLLALCVALPLCAAKGDVHLSLNGAPGVAGEYQPSAVTALTLENGLISITFGPDGTATSVVKKRQGTGAQSERDRTARSRPPSHAHRGHR
jgi:hypothetical protein